MEYLLNYLMVASNLAGLINFLKDLELKGLITDEVGAVAEYSLKNQIDVLNNMTQNFPDEFKIEPFWSGLTAEMDNANAWMIKFENARKY